jgi:hypothetical protein
VLGDGALGGAARATRKWRGAHIACTQPSLLPRPFPASSSHEPLPMRLSR